MEKNLLNFVIITIIFALSVVASKGNSNVPNYHDELSKLENHLIARLLKNDVDAKLELDSADENTNFGGHDIHEQKKRLRIPDGARFRPLPICRPYVPFLSTFQCCERGFTHVDLTNNSPCDGINTAAGVEILQQPTAQTSLTGDCNKRALLKINFEKFTKEPCDYCLRRPLCGRRMLRIDLTLSSGTRSGWGFNIGDSRTNDGYKGDANTQINDAEAEGVFPAVRLYHSDRCNSVGSFKTFADAIGPNVNQVTIYVSNQHIRIMNDQGFDEYVCDNCLYALNGQADSQGINEDIYIGLNRVITGRSDRNGQGVCSATLTWICPRW
ncbi:uncharacterized protein LOC132756946 [Ruditapes philippinarum]|uniref:uncharacterized protein LOC132756946 n=1 Tax=Ruditapes philippinarum TaxID=129788 RepID=UPI00295A9F44|nr:uncharacterized protein LOC132756946 [Ruditapes philippinarum]